MTFSVDIMGRAENLIKVTPIVCVQQLSDKIYAAISQILRRN